MNEKGDLRINKLPYTIVPNEVLKRNDLSLKAKGLIAYLLSLPDNWNLFKTELTSHFTDGKDSISSAWKELEDNDYIHTTEIREKGMFKGYLYSVYGVPTERKPIEEKPQSDKSKSDNPPLINTNSNNKELIIKEKLKNLKILFLEQQSNIDTIKMQNRVPDDFFLYLVDAFFIELQINEENNKTLRDAISHFNRWIRSHKRTYEKEFKELNQSAQASSSGDLFNQPKGAQL